MFDVLVNYWPHILAAISILGAAAASIHATMTKEDVRAANGWVGVAILSPLVGPTIYALAGINRMRRASIHSQRSVLGNRALEHLILYDVADSVVHQRYGGQFSALKTLGDRVARNALTSGNSIEMLETGDEAYAKMCDAIDTAKRSVLMETYIFDNDRIGKRLVDALGRAVSRGIEVRVLIDAVGARYSVPSVLRPLQSAGVRTAVFNGNIIMGLRLPYANLRTHRKIIVVDGCTAFTGGMNIREAFTSEFAAEHVARDTHFKLSGPIVADLFSIAAYDWRFTTKEVLAGHSWHIETPEQGPDAPILMRAVPSGPDSSLETNHKMLIGAFSTARKSIRIMSPYFLPDRELISALITAGRKGVEIDIVVPAANNLVLVDRAMTAQFDQVLKNYCRVWRAEGSFNHSKLLAIDETWAYVGSSNLDARSLRLNFEVDLEVLDADFASSIHGRIGEAMETSRAVTLESLRSRPFLVRLVDKFLWLGSPYL
ncbi:phospholipase D-like domain-containing protein [Oryzicola mucosus]|uniref:Phospholipase D n=1 Tax=Oryzicola mucosus TaxID=2767425 RepID=A0A8J6PV09_9HYPH|nr:phosphatidylserine/phosphatidylglycerophosphate/cardiolipin synthase family protein [Oryzicola mucosus]MBD0415171.1 phosphatidylserine/phosphatidylglycerophosphate/cardiolipin synthase family protein [Oryzicola mucosus]